MLLPAAQIDKKKQKTHTKSRGCRRKYHIQHYKFKSHSQIFFLLLNQKIMHTQNLLENAFLAHTKFSFLFILFFLSL